MPTDRECSLCKEGLEEKIDANAALAKEAVKQAIESVHSLRREIKLASGTTITLTGVFISVLGLLLYLRVI